MLFAAHYINRDLIYPMRIKTDTKIPLEIVIAAFTFTSANGYLQCYGSTFNLKQISIFQQVLGVCIFLTGMFINIHSDNILQRYKQIGLKQYKE